MLTKPMYEEVIEYQDRCLTYIQEASSRDNAMYWQERYNECKTLLTLFNEMKMCWSDWARMRSIAILNREIRSMGVSV